MDMAVINKNNNKMYQVYDITYDKAGHPHFLIYKDGEWIRMSTKHFKPYEYELPWEDDGSWMEEF